VELAASPSIAAIFSCIEDASFSYWLGLYLRRDLSMQNIWKVPSSPSISAEQRYVAFYSYASNWVKS
jgi:hypothetical protein